MSITPLKFYAITTKRNSRLVRTIEVQKRGGSYRVHRIDVTSLMTGGKSEESIAEKTLGVYKTLEDANEKATSIHHKTMGWV